MQPKNSQIKVDVMSVTKSGTDFILPIARASLFDGMRLALSSTVTGVLTAKTSDSISLGSLLMVAGGVTEVYVSFNGDGSFSLIPINGVRGNLFDTGWHNGKRATLPVGTVAMDGQQLLASLYPDLVAGVLAGNQNVVTEAEWQADPLKRGCWSSGNLSTWVRAPDMNGVQAGSSKAFYLRGGTDVLSGTAVGDAIREIAGGFSGYSSGKADGNLTVNGPFGNSSIPANGIYTGSAVTSAPTNMAATFAASRVVPTADENRVKSAYGVWWVRVFGSVMNPGSVDAAYVATQQDVLRGRLDTPVFTQMNGGAVSGFRNVIINGNMEIAQRGTSLAITSGTGGYVVDRFRLENVSQATGTGVMSQTDTGMAWDIGFMKALSFTATAAHSTTAASALAMAYSVEGYDCRRLYGKTFTLSFWAKSPRTGKHAIAFRSSDPSSMTRTFVSEYDVKLANTWAKYTVTLIGGIPINDAVGTWNTTTGRGLDIIWAWNTGTNYRTATMNAWQSGNFVAASGAVNAVQANNDAVSITGVQLEVGAVATDFEHRGFAVEIGMCQRYYCKTFPYGVAPVQGVGNFIGALGAQSVNGSNGPWVHWMFPVAMRVPPTVITYSPTIPGESFWRNIANTASTAVDATKMRPSESGVYIAGSSVVATDTHFIHATANAEI